MVHSPAEQRARQRAEVGHRPFKADQAQQALDEPGHLSQSHTEQNLHRKAGLNRGVAIAPLATAPAGRRGLPVHLGVEPALRRLSAFAIVAQTNGATWLTVGWPVLSLVGRGRRSTHAGQRPSWIHDMNPFTGFVQQSIESLLKLVGLDWTVPPCCRNCSISSHPNKRLVAPPRTGIPSDRWQSYPHSHPARTQNYGSRTLLERSHETKPSGRRNISAGRFGKIGVAITAEAAARARCLA